MKTVTIPFDLELAKKIQNGEVEGKIVDNCKTEYEIVKWDAKGDYPPIATFFDEEYNSIRVNTFTGQGAYNRRGRTELDLQLVVPEYLTWKEGDYLTINNSSIIIYKSYTIESHYPIEYYVLYGLKSENLYFYESCLGSENITPSTPYEIAKLTDALLKKGKAWNPKTKQIEEVDHVFKPLDLILVKSNCWELCQYAFVKDGWVHTVGGLAFSEWIPYEDNEYLLGTTNEPEEHEN